MEERPNTECRDRMALDNEPTTPVVDLDIADDHERRASQCRLSQQELGARSRARAIETAPPSRGNSMCLATRASKLRPTGLRGDHRSNLLRSHARSPRTRAPHGRPCGLSGDSNYGADDGARTRDIQDHNLPPTRARDLNHLAHLQESHDLARWQSSRFVRVRRSSSVHVGQQMGSKM